MSAHHDDAPHDDLHPFHFALLLVGGLLVGTGAVNLISAFGWVGGDINSDFSQVGFSGLDQIGLLPGADLALPLVVVGALCLIIANANAWKQTGGY